MTALCTLRPHPEPLPHAVARTPLDHLRQLLPVALPCARALSRHFKSATCLSPLDRRVSGSAVSD